jgi:hypothetical protein
MSMVPAAALGAAVDWTQKVLPVEVSRCWCTTTCLLTGVRAIALSQSLPTAYTHDPTPVLGTLRSGAPHAALDAAVAAMPAALMNVTTASESWNPPDDGVAVTVCEVSVPLARAHQISESSDCVLLRLARVHVRPAPVTVRPRRPGPSEETKATSRSSAAEVVVRLGLVKVPEPSVKIVLSTVTGPTALGVTALDAAEAGPVPMALVAETVKV